MRNPFKDAQGETVRPFSLEAEAWDMCLDSVKRRGFYINEKTWDCDLPHIVRNLRGTKAGYLIFIEDEGVKR